MGLIVSVAAVVAVAVHSWPVFLVGLAAEVSLLALLYTCIAVRRRRC